jgi:hypothetical protein
MHPTDRGSASDLIRLRRPRRRGRGTASVEAVVALPFFILVLSGVWFVRDRQLAIQSAENQARSCAWQYSANDCSSIPKGCEGVLSPGTAPPTANAIDNALNDAKSEVLAGGDSKGVIEKVAAGILGPAIDALFGRFVEGKSSRTLNRPGVLGGGQAVFAGSYHLACNLQPTTPAEVVEDAWNKIVGF